MIEVLVGSSFSMSQRQLSVDYPFTASSESSSSIGSPDESEEEEEEDENDAVSSKLGLGFGLECLEESLPFKRGLSKHYRGKSKSYGNLLTQVKCNTMKQVEKTEKPFNKRRRILLANKLFQNKFSFFLQQHGEDEEEDYQQQNYEDEDEDEAEAECAGRVMMDVRFKSSFKSYSCLSLADFQHKHHHVK